MQPVEVADQLAGAAADVQVRARDAPASERVPLVGEQLLVAAVDRVGVRRGLHLPRAPPLGVLDEAVLLRDAQGEVVLGAQRLGSRSASTSACG